MVPQFFLKFVIVNYFHVFKPQKGFNLVINLLEYISGPTGTDLWEGRV